MKTSVFMIWFLIGAVSATAQTPKISPVAPSVNQGAKQQFSCLSNCGKGGTWLCTRCTGTIDPRTGVYTAPASVRSAQSIGGYQVLPNNHIYNTDISSVALRSDSAVLISASPRGWFSFANEWPLNYVAKSTPPVRMNFVYTPSNDGPFPMPVPPFARSESGWLNARVYDPLNGKSDHHVPGINTSNGNLFEVYGYYPAGTDRSHPNTNSRSGVIYGANQYVLPTGTSDAAGMMIQPATLRLHELEQAVATGSYVHHALRMTMSNYALHNAYLWPATSSTNNGLGPLFYGQCFRLKSSFNISGYNAIQQAILKTMQHYCTFIADGGYNYDVTTEYARWPLTYLRAFAGLGNAHIGVSNFELPDLATIQITPASGETALNRETVTYTANTGSASTDVVLVGPVVNFPKDIIYIQAGSPAITIPVYHNFGALTFSLGRGGVGSIDSSTGVYTPPTNVFVPTTFAVNVANTAGSGLNTSDTLQMTVFPAGVIRICPFCRSNFTDTSGNIWYAGAELGGDSSCDYNTESCYGTYPLGVTGSNAALYNGIIRNNQNDTRFDFYVANGTYQIVAKMAENQSQTMVIEPQGVAGSSLNLYTACGSNTPCDQVSNVTVTTGLLSYVLRKDSEADISALEIRKTH